MINFRKHWRLTLAVILGGFVAFHDHGCSKAQSVHKTTKEVPSTPVLPKQDKEIIHVSPNKVTITTQSGTQTITGSRDTKVEITKDGQIKVTEKTVGFEHQLGADIYGGRYLGVGMDFRFAYFKDFDALTGLGYLPNAHKLDVWLGCSYTIHNSWVSNTAVFIGYSPISKTPVAGLGIRF